MICINNDLIIKDRAELNIYIEELLKQVTDKNSKKVIDAIVNYINDVWERSEKVEAMMKKYSTDEIFPMCYIDIYDTADLTQLKIEAFTRDFDYEPKEKDIVAFEQFCNRYFSSLKSLYDIFCSIDL